MFIQTNKTPSNQIYQLPCGSNKAYERTEIFRTDHLPEFLTTKDIETHYRIKAQYIRDLICRHKRDNKAMPFTILHRSRTILIERISFEDWLLRQSNAVPIDKNTRKIFRQTSNTNSHLKAAC
jgi:hypothetical protein